MTIQQLRYLSAIVECGSISKAAQKLYVSQPSISAAVRALEDELGITVFARSAKGITVTGEGRELLKMGNRILQDADYVREFFSSSEKETTPSFYVSSQHYDFVVTAFEQFVRSMDPEMYAYGLIQGQTGTVLENVAKQYSDLGVIFLSDVNRHSMQKTLADRHLVFHPLVKTAPHVFVDRSHPLAGRPVVRAAELLKYPCIRYEQDFADPAFFSEEMILSDFYPPKVLYISDLYISVGLRRECGAYDIGTGIIGPRLRENLCAIPIDTEDVVEVGWISLKGKTLRPLEKKFISILKKHIETGSSRT